MKNLIIGFLLSVVFAYNSDCQTIVNKMTKSTVGLQNVENTSDLNKPISTLTQTALTAKFDKTGGFIDGNVGVGIPVATEKLHIRWGNFLVEADEPLIKMKSPLLTISALKYSNGILFLGNGSGQSLTVNSGGSVGIGIDSPLEKLHIRWGKMLIEADSPTIQMKTLDGTVINVMQFNAGTGNIMLANGSIEAEKWGGATTMYVQNGNGKVGIGTRTPTSKLQVVGLPTFADNASAVSGGLTVGAFYRTSTGVLMVVF